MSIKERVIKIIKEHLGLRDDEITLESDIFNDFGADSLDGVEIVIGLEEEFSIEISDEEGEETVIIKDIIELVESRIKANENISSR